MIKPPTEQQLNSLRELVAWAAPAMQAMQKEHARLPYEERVWHPLHHFMHAMRYTQYADWPDLTEGTEG